MFLPITRGGTLLIGCLLAFWLPGRRVHPAVAPMSLLLLIVVLFGAPTPDHIAPHAGAASSLAALAAAGLIAGTVNGGLIARVLSWEPLVWFGQRSYGIYLWQLPIALTLRYAGYRRPLPIAIVTIAGATLIAALSYRFVEQRFWRRSVGAASPAPAPEASPAIAGGVADTPGNVPAG